MILENLLFFLALTMSLLAVEFIILQDQQVWDTLVFTFILFSFMLGIVSVQKIKSSKS